ncbi:hypothetical protein [Compostimonas suwonensis]|uniref:hypothetical protein n=1 Tax=Compostimonas suwonensis TaxID=1048394 RepID=UPI0014732D23|nr:hypothetical protein [Compostimonas suwonensis]
MNPESTADTGTDDALVSRLRLIEDQPLDQRADAYVHVHDELRARLEGGDVSTSA